MAVFFTLLWKLIPLYVIILLGFFAGKYLRAQKETVASLLIYNIAPLIIFHGTVTTKLTWELLFLPVIFYVVCCIFCLSFFHIASFFWKDTHRNIIAFTAGSGNTGYFGLPVALVLLGEESLGIMVLCILGFVFYESSLGFFITAKGHHTAREAFTKVLKIPTLYAFFLGLIVNLAGIELGETYFAMAQNFRGAYTILGMMIIGLGIGGMKHFQIDWLFLGVTFFAKFIAWPLAIGGLILLDLTIFHLFEDNVHKVMFLISIVPLAANTVAFATELRTEPEKAALAVLLSTLVALVTIPLFAVYFF